MKKVLTLLLAISMILTLSACGGKKEEEAFELSKSAFYNINDAYERLDAIGNDIITAWNLGIYERNSLLGWTTGFPFFCDNLTVSKDSALDGLAAAYSYAVEQEYELDLEYYKESVREYSDLYWDETLRAYGLDNTFSACIFVVVESYRQNGELDEIGALLSSATETIKELSENHSDYEHYDAIKKYFATTNTYYNYCCNPSGTLEEAQSNMNKYNNDASEAYNSLYYFFE